ncbi:MAG: GspH/FimT family pseudopilin [Thermodesulfobacteriota bacterium]
MSRAGEELTEWAFSIKGFTLIELVVVMMIVGLAVTLTLPVFSRSINGFELRRSVQEVRAALRYAREMAITYQSPMRFAFDIEGDRYWLADIDAPRAAVPGSAMDKAIPLYHKVEIEGFRWIDGSRASEVGWIEFYPNGSSSGGSLLLKAAETERMRRIVMEPFTGLSHVESVHYVR